ncbi:MAG: Gfo/Idh/MocA family oxidoreductase [Betaproteobacteria bacterium]|nr:Gfo/Idh/MocA family oxidoreductase [Betaproteobacteria bacterium]
MLKAAIYGVGRWGETLVNAAKDSGKIRIVKGVTRDPAKHREFTDKTGVALVKNYADVLGDPEVKAVVLATPHSLHHEHVVQAARAGKHVYCEKPFTLTRASAEDAVAACKAAGVTLALGFNRRYAPSFRELLRRVNAGEIGDVLHIEAQHSGPTGYRLKAGTWRSTRKEAPGGGMTARGIHALDNMINIAGLVSSVYAFSDKRKLPVDIDIDDTTSMLLRFAGGVTGYLATVFVTGELYRVHVFGSKGWIEMRGDTRLTVCGIEGVPEEINLPKASKERALLDAFADAVAAKQPFLVPPEEVINGIAVLEAIEGAAAKGQPVRIG